MVQHISALKVIPKAGFGECPKSGSGLKPQVFQRKLLMILPITVMMTMMIIMIMIIDDNSNNNSNSRK